MGSQNPSFKSSNGILFSFYLSFDFRCIFVFWVFLFCMVRPPIKSQAKELVLQARDACVCVCSSACIVCVHQRRARPALHLCKRNTTCLHVRRRPLFGPCCASGGGRGRGRLPCLYFVGPYWGPAAPRVSEPACSCCS